MRRGGRLLLLLGVIIAAIVALVVIFVLRPGVATNPEGQLLPPTVEPTRRVVIARVDIPRNTPLTDTVALLDFVEIPESQYNADPTSYFINTSELASKVTIRDVAVTAPILSSDVTDAGLSGQIPVAQAGQPSLKAISVSVNNLTGVADEITIGDFVDVIASFNVNRTYLRPGFNDEGGVQFVEEQFTGLTTKTLIQNVQVLRIKRPEIAPEGTTTPTAQSTESQLDESGQPIQSGVEGSDTGVVTTANGATITPGSWILVLAMTDQQNEILKFSREQGNAITLVLRGRGDNTTETTLGATLDLLVNNFGLPLPVPAQPAISEQTALTPVAAPPAVPTATPTP